MFLCSFNSFCTLNKYIFILYLLFVCDQYNHYHFCVCLCHDLMCVCPYIHKYIFICVHNYMYVQTYMYIYTNIHLRSMMMCTYRHVYLALNYTIICNHGYESQSFWQITSDIKPAIDHSNTNYKTTTLMWSKLKMIHYTQPRQFCFPEIYSL